MRDDNVTAPNAGDRFRKAQSLVVEHLDLNPQDTDATKRLSLKEKIGNLLAGSGGKRRREIQHIDKPFGIKQL